MGLSLKQVGSGWMEFVFMGLVLEIRGFVLLGFEEFSLVELILVLFEFEFVGLGFMEFSFVLVNSLFVGFGVEALYWVTKYLEFKSLDSMYY